MSLLHSIIPYETVFPSQMELRKRDEIMYEGMLVEVELDEDNIILSRLIHSPIENYLDPKYLPGTVIGKRHSFIG